MDDFLVLVDSKIEALRARELASRTQPDATWWTESEWYRNTVDSVGALLARADVFPEVGGPRPSKQSDDPAYVQEPLHSHGAGRFRAVQGLKDGLIHVAYDDGDEEHLDMSKEQYKVLQADPLVVVGWDAALES
eukprot:gene34010-biopygen1602